MTTEDKKGPEAAATAGAGDQNLRKGSIMGNSTNREHHTRLSDGTPIEARATDVGQIAVRVDGGRWRHLKASDVGPLSVALIGAAFDAGAAPEDMQQGDADEPVPVPVEIDHVDGVRTLRGPEHGLVRLRESRFAEGGSTERLVWFERWGDGVTADEAERLIGDLRMVLDELGRPLVEGDGEVQG